MSLNSERLSPDLIRIRSHQCKRNIFRFCRYRGRLLGLCLLPCACRYLHISLIDSHTDVYEQETAGLELAECQKLFESKTPGLAQRDGASRYKPIADADLQT